jgi:hypothetical protein
MAVGSSGDQALIEHWNGHNWARVASPAPGAAVSASLVAVACPSSVDCVALGSYITASFDVGAFSDLWDGHLWVTREMPAPPGAVDADLTGISCASASSCMAVGYAFDLDGFPQTLAEIWDGDGWQVLPAPGYRTGSELSAVSCRSKLGCVVIGLQFASPATKEVEYFWSTKRWTVTALPILPSVPGDVALTALACPTKGFCMLAGYYAAQTTGQIVPASESWDGKTWTVHAAEAKGTKGTELRSIHCVSSSFCVAVGGYAGAVEGLAAGLLGLSEIWNGKSWRIVDVPGPTGASTGSLSGVRCVSATRCEAVGGYAVDGGDSIVTAADAWSGSAWRLQRSSTPVTALVTDPTSVSCAPSGKCELVGGFVGGVGIFAFAESWTGSLWSVQKSVWPANTYVSVLESVACPSADSCTAVGAALSTAEGNRALAESWNGHRWTVDQEPSPGTGVLSGLLSVSCASDNSCMAVGEEQKTHLAPLAEDWNGKIWKQVAVPTPKGARGSLLGGVSCSRASACVAVGTYLTASGSGVGFAAVWNGATWTDTAEASVKGATDYGLSALSCTSADECEGVGSYVTGMAGNERTFSLAESFNGAEWSLQTAAQPGPNSELTDVSCTSATSCTAIGDYTPNASSYDAVVEVWTGTAWKIQAPPSVNAELLGVSCVSSGSCMLVAEGEHGAFSATEGSP